MRVKFNDMMSISDGKYSFMSDYLFPNLEKFRTIDGAFRSLRKRAGFDNEINSEFNFVGYSREELLINPYSGSRCVFLGDCKTPYAYILGDFIEYKDNILVCRINEFACFNPNGMAQFLACFIASLPGMSRDKYTRCGISYARCVVLTFTTDNKKISKLMEHLMKLVKDGDFLDENINLSETLSFENTGSNYTITWDHRSKRNLIYSRDIKYNPSYSLRRALSLMHSERKTESLSSVLNNISCRMDNHADIIANCRDSIMNWLFHRNLAIIYKAMGEDPIDVCVTIRYKYSDELVRRLKESKARYCAPHGTGCIDVSMYYTEKMISTAYFGNLSSYRFHLSRWTNRAKDRYKNFYSVGYTFNNNIVNAYCSKSPRRDFGACVVPYITKGIYNHTAKLIAFEDWCRETLTYATFSDSFNSVLNPIAALLGVDFAKDYALKLDEIERHSTANHAVHDVVYPLYNCFSSSLTHRDLVIVPKYLTAGALKKWLLSLDRSVYSLVVNAITTLNSMIKGKSNHRKLLTEYRKKISTYIKNGTFDAIESEINALEQQKEEAEAKKNITFYTKKGMDILEEFLAGMKRYADIDPSLSKLEHLFNKANVKKFLFGTYPCVFSPKDYTIPSTLLGKEVKKCLGHFGHNAAVKNPRGLYKTLSTICDVKKIIDGNIKGEQVEKVINTLKHHGHIVDKLVADNALITGKIERKGNPAFLVAGDATVCCMSFGSGKAVDYALQEGFGIFNVYYKDRIVANSVIYINDRYNALVIDNIEVNANYTKLTESLRTIYNIMINDVMKEYDLDYCLLGTTYNDMDLVHRYSQSIAQKNILIRGNVHQPDYIDSEHVYVVEGEYLKFINKVKQVTNAISEGILEVQSHEICNGRKSNDIWDLVGEMADEEDEEEEEEIEDVLNFDLA